MNTLIWAKAHGAATHFPFAFALAAVASDGVAWCLADRPVARDFAAIGFWAMLAAALASIGAVASGLMLTRGVLWGHGPLRMHHLFAWPAFVALAGLATWRSVAGVRLPRRVLTGYVGAELLTAGLVTSAAYWGGELILRT